MKIVACTFYNKTILTHMSKIILENSLKKKKCDMAQHVSMINNKVI